MAYLRAKPAFGREYANAAEVVADWMAGRDFYVQPSVITRGGYVSIRELPEADTLNIYFADSVDGIVSVTRHGEVPVSPMEAEEVPSYGGPMLTSGPISREEWGADREEGE